jgi:hypothetical protein
MPAEPEVTFFAKGKHNGMKITDLKMVINKTGEHAFTGAKDTGANLEEVSETGISVDDPKFIYVNKAEVTEATLKQVSGQPKFTTADVTTATGTVVDPIVETGLKQTTIPGTGMGPHNENTRTGDGPPSDEGATNPNEGGARKRSYKQKTQKRRQKKQQRRKSRRV